MPAPVRINVLDNHNPSNQVQAVSQNKLSPWEEQALGLSKLRFMEALTKFVLSELSIIPAATDSSDSTDPFIDAANSDFNEELSMTSDDSPISLSTTHQMLKVEKIRHSIDEHQNLKYYRFQFLSSIIEEVKFAANSSLKSIVLKGKSSLASRVSHPHASVIITRLPRNSHRSRDKSNKFLVGDFRAKELPKLNDNRQFNVELVLLLPPGGSAEERRFPTEEYLKRKGVRAIVSGSHRHHSAHDYDDSVDDTQSSNDDQNKFIKLRVEIFNDDLRKLSSLERMAFMRHIEDGTGDIDMYWLVGLVPAMRMFDACADQDCYATSVFDQIAKQIDMKQWPVANAIEGSFSDKLNQQQNEIIQSSQQIEDGVYLLQGPPGTGKTTTITHMLLALGNNPRYQYAPIMVCGPSNKSVLVLLDRAIDVSQSLGIPMALNSAKHNLPDKLKPYDINNIVNCIAEPLKNLKNDLTKRYPADHRHCQPYQSQYEELIAAVIESSTRFQTILHRKRVDTILTIGVTNGLAKVSRALHDIIHNKPITSYQEIQHLLDDLSGLIRIINNHKSIIEKFFVNTSRIIFSTLVASGRKSFRKMISQVSCLIVDEATQALIPETLIPIVGFYPEVIFLVGDHKQLPPTVQSNRNRHAGYGISLFSSLVEMHNHPHQMLTTQYRMHDDICRWPSQQFYDGRLISATENALRVHPAERIFGKSDNAKVTSIFFDTLGAENRYCKGSQSTSNDIEAIQVIDILKSLSANPSINMSKISVITFYAAKKNLIREKVQKDQMLKNKIKYYKIDTVDGFQGEEDDIVIISFVRTCQSVGFLTDHRRINVAMTRAKHLRIMVGDVQTLKSCNSDAMRSLLARPENYGVLVPPVNTLTGLGSNGPSGTK